MADETMTQEQTMTPEETLAKLMRESVPKEQYEALQKQYNDFFQNVASGHFTKTEEGTQEPTEDEKQQEFYKAIDTINSRKFHGPVQFMENALIIDNYLKEHGQRSAFAPSRGDITADIETQNETLNEIFQDALEAADGDDNLCTAYFAKCVDAPLRTGRR